MSMIPADLSAMPSTRPNAATEAPRLPRAVGWLMASAISAGLWILVIDVIRLAI